MWGIWWRTRSFRVRVLQQFSSRRPEWVRNWFPDPMPVSSAGQPWCKGHSMKHPGPAEGKLRVTAQSLPDAPHREQNSPEHPRGEHQTASHRKHQSSVHQSSDKQWVTRPGLKSLFNGISLQKNSFTWCPWYPLLHNNLVIPCPTATRAHEYAGKQPAQVREFNMKTEVIFMHIAVLATSER